MTTSYGRRCVACSEPAAIDANWYWECPRCSAVEAKFPMLFKWVLAVVETAVEKAMSNHRDEDRDGYR